MNKQEKIFWFLVAVIVVIVVIGTFFGRKSTPVPEPTPTPTQTVKEYMDYMSEGCLNEDGVEVECKG